MPLKFGIAVGAGSYLPMNCSMTPHEMNLYIMDYDIICPIYDEAIQLVSNGTVRDRVWLANALYISPTTRRRLGSTARAAARNGPARANCCCQNSGAMIQVN